MIFVSEAERVSAKRQISFPFFGGSFLGFSKPRNTETPRNNS